MKVASAGSSVGCSVRWRNSSTANVGSTYACLAGASTRVVRQPRMQILDVLGKERAHGSRYPGWFVEAGNQHRQARRASDGLRSFSSYGAEPVWVCMFAPILDPQAETSDPPRSISAARLRNPASSSPVDAVCGQAAPGEFGTKRIPSRRLRSSARSTPNQRSKRPDGRDSRIGAAGFSGNTARASSACFHALSEASRE